MIRRLFLIALLATVGFAADASAGVYSVRACWDGEGVNHAWRHAASSTTVESFTQCPAGPQYGTSNAGMTARNSLGPSLASPFTYAEAYFDAPPGTRIVRVWGDYNLISQQGWAAGLVDAATNTWRLCGTTCLSTFGWQPFDVPFSTSRVAARTICGRGEGCSRSGRNGSVSLRNTQVVLQEDGVPSVSIAGGSLVSGGWRRGVQDVAVNASDPVGIGSVAVRIDGAEFDRQASGCDFTFAIPCPARSIKIPVDLSLISDGRHNVTVHTTDSAGNPNQTGRTIYVDNHAPSRPVNLGVDGGSGWRSQNLFGLRWHNPRQSAAPITSARVELCRLPNLASCVTTSSSRRDLTSMGVRLPGAGEWRTRVWLVDAAGNQGPESYAETVLRLDDEPPALALLTPSSDRPALVRVRASDRSGLSVREIHLRRRSTATWNSLPVKAERGGYSTILDDEGLPDGVYEIRARAVDLAGNERSSDRLAGGKPLLLAFPLRIRTRLAVGRPTRIRARGADGRLRYRIKLIRSPRAHFGRTIRLRGRLTSPGGNPLSGRDVRVFQQTKLPAATWKALATVRTNAKGRFTFRALRGPSRSLRFRYDGSDTIQGRTAEVRLGVRAASSIYASRRNVVNGEDVTFRGRLRGGPRPSPGKLIEIQARTRGGWRTFATTRASRRTGRWAYRYRFSATRGTVRYRFRARVPKESSYPYETGASRSVLVRVRGL